MISFFILFVAMGIFVYGLVDALEPADAAYNRRRRNARRRELAANAKRRERERNQRRARRYGSAR